MKKIHNIHNHKIVTKEGFTVFPGQTIYVDDEGKTVDPNTELEKKIDENSNKSSDSGLVYKGAWTQPIEYKVNDVVTLNGSSYVCIKDHTSSFINPPSSNSSNWKVFAAKGADGAKGSSDITRTVYQYGSISRTITLPTLSTNKWGIVHLFASYGGRGGSGSNYGVLYYTYFGKDGGYRWFLLVSGYDNKNLSQKSMANGAITVNDNYTSPPTIECKSQDDYNTYYSAALVDVI